MKNVKPFNELFEREQKDAIVESTGAQYRADLDRYLPLHDAPNPMADAKKLAKDYSWEPDELLSICYNIMVEINEHKLAADFVEIVKKSYEA
jgi:hypothetical protein